MIRKQYGRNIQGKLFSKALKLNETGITVKLMHNPVVFQIFNKQFYRYFLKSFQINDVDITEMKADTGIIIKNDCQMLPVIYQLKFHGTAYICGIFPVKK